MLCKTLYLFIFVNFYIIMGNFVYATENALQINFNIVERLARLEEGQKTIIAEMQARFEASDKRFESILREMNKRFEAVDQRFESLIREMNHRFESVDKRIDQLSNYIIAMMGLFVTIFLAIIGYAVWDRKVGLEKIQEKSEKLIYNHKQHEHFSPINEPDKVNQLLNIMRKMSEQIPEMRTMMHAAQLL
ncbi:conserved hypothetical protein, membrane [Candidatus Magnetomorum sp. HK-1]|nr:conserved hypothetical protein, membrane [Candidatus Magnetomorum sp. HK-1]